MKTSIVSYKKSHIHRQIDRTMIKMKTILLSRMRVASNKVATTKVIRHFSQNVESMLACLSKVDAEAKLPVDSHHHATHILLPLCQHQVPQEG